MIQVLKDETMKLLVNGNFFTHKSKETITK